MLFLATEIESAAWGLIGAAFTAAGAVIVQLIMARHKVTQDERADIRNEWKDLSEHQDAQITSLQTRVEKLEGDKIELLREVGRLETEVAVLNTRLGVKDKARGG